jgi:hypothetical protein|tara:strand:+ start:708 stop:887 length:180 start_codon:yes stop_codon:yes gene_type:complete
MATKVIKTTYNSKRWQDNSDGWIAAMTKSKDNKQLYQEYLKSTKDADCLMYRYWLREQK